MKKNYSKLLLMAITLAATACSQPQDTTRIDEARNRATAAADSVVAADSTGLMALQKSILAAKAVQSEYLLTGDTAAADIAADVGLDAEHLAEVEETAPARHTHRNLPHVCRNRSHAPTV